jgi:multisubunit Na+/H+ antiporter MnhC subunit
VFNAPMDTGPMIVSALLMTAIAMKMATKGRPIPGYLLAVFAAMVAIYAMRQEEVRSQIVLAWAICGTAILSAYVGTQVQRNRGD